MIDYYFVGLIVLIFILKFLFKFYGSGKCNFFVLLILPITVFTLNFKYICKAHFIMNFYNETMNKILLKFYPRLPLNERTTIII